MALFGEGVRTRREPRSVVEFRAGKMTLSGTTVSPDKRKGLVFMKMEDNLLHFCWKDRTSGQIEDDFIIFPGDAEIKHISQCKTGRVLLLKFKESSRRYFYWLQEPKDDKDEEYIKKVNDFIDNPNSALVANAESDRRGFPSGLMTAQLQNILQGTPGGGGGEGGGISQQQLLELLALSGASPLDILTGRTISGRSEPHGLSGATEESQAPPRRQNLQLGDLQSVLESLNIPPSNLPESNVEPQEPVDDRITLSDVATSEALRPLIKDDEAELSPHLPPTNEPIETAVSTPQFQQAIGVFSSALSSGQLGPLVTEFGLSADVASAAATGSVERFAEALENELKGEKESEKKKEEGNDNDKRD